MGVVGDGGASDEIAAMEAALKMTPEEATLMRSDPEAPEFVAAVPRFQLDIEALMSLSRSETPTLRPVQGWCLLWILRCVWARLWSYFTDWG